MNEKEILIQNVNNAMPVAEKMKPIEDEISKLDVKSGGRIQIKSVVFLFLFLIFTTSILDQLINCRAPFPNDIIFSAIFGFLSYKTGIKQLMDKIRAKRTIPVLKQKLSEIANDGTLSWLPEEYRTSGCINAMSRYISAGRVENLKEALNLLDLDLHRERMEGAAMIGAYAGETK